MIIYKITNSINNKIYIGQTVRTVKERMQEHCRQNKTLIDKSIQKYGKENFIVEIIDTAKNINELNEKEIQWIKKENSKVPNGYNLCDGGGNSKGYEHTIKSKKKMSQIQIKNGNQKGQKNHFYGKKHSEEALNKMREAWTTERKKELVNRSKKSNRLKLGKKIINLDTKEIFNSIIEAAEKYDVKATHISRVCKGKRKTTGGYRWQYANHDNTEPSPKGKV